MVKELKIVQEANAIMEDHVVTGFPNEVCGFFFGTESSTERHITSVRKVDNAKDGDKKRRFEISPFDYMKAEAFALKEGVQLLGVYHSHPQHPAIASEHDLKQAVPFFSYVIYSVIDGKIDDIKSWQLDENNSQFIEEQVEIIQTKKLVNN